MEPAPSSMRDTISSTALGSETSATAVTPPQACAPHSSFVLCRVICREVRNRTALMHKLEQMLTAPELGDLATCDADDVYPAHGHTPARRGTSMNSPLCVPLMVKRPTT